MEAAQAGKVVTSWEEGEGGQGGRAGRRGRGVKQHGHKATSGSCPLVQQLQACERRDLTPKP